MFLNCTGSMARCHTPRVLLCNCTSLSSQITVCGYFHCHYTKPVLNAGTHKCSASCCTGNRNRDVEVGINLRRACRVVGGGVEG